MILIRRALFTKPPKVLVRMFPGGFARFPFKDVEFFKKKYQNGGKKKFDENFI